MSRLVTVLVAIVALAFAASRFIDLSEALEHLEDYNWSLFPAALILSLTYYLLKALRWHYYLRVVGIRLALRDSVMIYLAGQWFAFAPAGEFARAYMLKRQGAGFSVASSTVMMQIIVDLLSLTAIGALTLLRFHELAFWVLLFGTVLVTATALFGHGLRFTGLPSPPFVTRLRAVVERPWQRYYEGSRAMLAWRPLLVGLALGMPTVLVGAATLYVVCLGYRALGLGMIDSAYIYSISQMAGAVSLVPHGVGAVEGSSLLLFGNLGVDLDNAAAAITLFRLSTVAWSIVVGGLAFVIMRVRRRRRVDASGLPPKDSPSTDGETGHPLPGRTT